MEMRYYAQPVGWHRLRYRGGAYRIRTGANGLEGRCATAAPMLRMPPGGGVLSCMPLQAF